MTKSLLLLVDDRGYIRSNCYQSQLAETLRENYRVRMLSLREIRTIPLVRVASYDRILSVLRLRSLSANLPAIARLLGGAPLHVYEQDVWQAFMDDSPWRGAYAEIAAKLNVSAFLVTSRWWCDFVAARGLPARFVRMGMLARHCNPGPDWDERPTLLGFQGTEHPHRRVFFNQIRSLGLTVDIFPSAPYEAYLEDLHRMRVFIHTENQPWQVDGKWLSRNALWIKETEVAARGTFSIRDYEDESAAYGIDELPTIFTFRNVEQIPNIVNRLETMPVRERRDRMVAAAETMRRRADWMTVVNAIEEGNGA